MVHTAVQTNGDTLTLKTALPHLTILIQTFTL
jgi:hypothetical protein